MAKLQSGAKNIRVRVEIKGKEQPERRIHSGAPRDEKNRRFVS